MDYVAPEFNLSAFNCPNCNAYSRQYWNGLERDTHIVGDVLKDTRVALCEHCGDFSLWIKESMIYPLTDGVPNPSSDMPEDVRKDYEEARSIVSRSPRGAAALLRLATEKLTNLILENEKGKNLNENTKLMVKKGLHKKVQQAADSLRVIGNNAVHPGQIDIGDNRKVANSLFGLVNIIFDDMISQPKKINGIYDMLTENDRTNIEKRDKKSD